MSDDISGVDPRRKYARRMIIGHSRKRVTVERYFTGALAKKRYLTKVERSHRRYTAALKRARSKQDAMNLYWRHKREHEVLLRRHLREALLELKEIKKKFK